MNLTICQFFTIVLFKVSIDQNSQKIISLMDEDEGDGGAPRNGDLLLDASVFEE